MPLKVVGGVYLERVEFPPDEVIFGSGGRAAFALKALDPGVGLTSFIGQDRKDAIDYHSQTVWDVPICGDRVPETVSFYYYHGLSRPIIRPTELPVADSPTLDVTGDAILQFGMLEGNAVVHGERVVFDPQNPETPELFDRSGSTAGELVYLLNRTEAQQMTGISDLQASADFLLNRSNVVAVVIKSGAIGAHVFTPGDSYIVRSYETSRVWPIGSGDVFAAVFTHYWATEQLVPHKAAELASRGAALYCARRNLPLKREDLEADDFEFPKLIPERQPAECTIYVAGPFFTMGQLWLVEEARNALVSAGFDVFSPYHDVGVGDAAVVVPEDLNGLKSANALLALCDELDAGTIFEVGYAVRHGIPVIAFAKRATDESMKMLRGTGCKVFSDFTSAVYHTEWSAMK